MNFKIGDWIEFYDEYEDFSPFKVEEKHMAFPADWWECVTLWSPKEGDWMWFYDMEYPMYYVLSRFVEKDKYGYWCHMHYSDVLVCFECYEPFTSSLPTFIRK